MHKVQLQMHQNKPYSGHVCRPQAWGCVPGIGFYRMESATPIRSPERVRITLIDDDASIRKGVCRLARSHGFACTALESGELALADPSLPLSQCLIMDIQLNGINGFETRDRLHAMGIRIPTVFISAHSEIASPEWVARMKGSPCLSKPFEETALISAIRALLEASAS